MLYTLVFANESSVVPLRRRIVMSDSDRRTSMGEPDGNKPEKLLVALYRAFNRSKSRMRETGKWPPGVAVAVLPRVDLGTLDDVSDDRLAIYIDLVPELARRGWVSRPDGYQPPQRDREVTLTVEGQEHARQLLKLGAI